MCLLPTHTPAWRPNQFPEVWPGGKCIGGTQKGAARGWLDGVEGGAVWPGFWMVLKGFWKGAWKGALEGGFGGDFGGFLGVVLEGLGGRPQTVWGAGCM